MESQATSLVLRIGGSALAGVIGYLVGVYAGVYLILSIWGLDAGDAIFPVVTTTIGSLSAGAGVALTVSRMRRLVAVVTAGALGAVVLAAVLYLNADFGFIAVAGGLVALITAAVARSGVLDGLTG